MGIAKIRSRAAADALAAKKDLTEATEKMYNALDEQQKNLLAANEESAGKINDYEAKAHKAISDAESDLDDRLVTLSTTIAANHKILEEEMEKLTDVTRGHIQTSEHDRQLIRDQNAAMQADMEKAIVIAIQQGEAKMKAVAQRSRENLSGAQKALLLEITETVEGFADKTFKTIQGKYSKIADNYMSLKAYAIAAEDSIIDAVAKGHGKALSSIGDLLQTIAGLSDVHVEKEEGLSPDSDIRSLFSTDRIKVDNITGKHGNFVFVNAHAVGLTNKLSEFEKLAVNMVRYEDALAKLTAALTAKKPAHHAAPRPMEVSPPEYKGD